MPRQFARGIRKRGNVPEAIKASTTDSEGQVYLLVEVQYNFWKIRSADKIGHNGQSFRVAACGDRAYVRREWDKFVETEKAKIADNYQAFVRRSLRQTISRA